ncbi:MAG: glycoside hydrolase family 2 [Ruminococcaceae bacterium]|nr:glycoside hydrolase family 2 [Oscillospiraceae bacterium]
MKAKNTSFCDLFTPFEKSGGAGWEEYPRPQMKRESYLSLCGEWELFSRTDGGEEYLGKIKVPFVPESRLSNIGRKKERDEKYIYKKTFKLNGEIGSSQALLHFGAADQTARVWLNGTELSEHVGGYLPFSYEVGELLQRENTLTVEITDTLDRELAYGKQREKRGGMWYTPISGIWQPVWLEGVAKDYIKSVKLTPTLDSITIESEGGTGQKKLVIHTERGDIERLYEGDSITVRIDNAKNWTPEEPYLYYFTLTCGEDRIESYFALRTVTVEKRKGRAVICLNGEPYFFHGLLDQGYFSDGIYLPASPEGYKWDVLTMKRLGFNMLRKHIKTEPDIFYYYCDLYGMAVFQDMVNSGVYRYIQDTVLPTIGIKKSLPRKASPRRARHFEEDSRKTVALLYNHPSVCYYTIFNEGWGQYDTGRIYKELKALDPTRIWDSASGWFDGGESDVKSEHVYFRKIKLKPHPKKPLVLSEFGGYSYKVWGHSFNLADNYGYKTFRSPEELTAGLEELYLSEIVPQIEESGLCAAVLTQLSDVEDETNGLCTYDRQIVKVDEDTMKSIWEKLYEAFSKSFPDED